MMTHIGDIPKARYKTGPGLRIPVDLDALMEAQRLVQLAIGGDDPRERTEPEQMVYVREMALAATDELHEALAETGWKTWASSDHINREAFGAELCDALQFIFNLFTLAGWSAIDIERTMTRKHAINMSRVSDGYTGLEKCRCGRALDDPATPCVRDSCAYLAGGEHDYDDPEAAR